MNTNNIPNDLKQLPRWVCWKLIEREGKLTKIPINPVTGGQAMSNNPDTWSSFKTAYGRVQALGCSGIGFMFNGDGILGVDIDHCRDAETGKLSDLAMDIINTLDSYTELSQSGTGIHIICKGKLPEGRRRKEPVEMYEDGRYFCMTGNVLDDAHIEIEERTPELAAVHEKYVNVQKSRKNDAKTSKAANDTHLFVDDDRIIEIAMNAKNGDLFTDLMNGNWKGRYTSQSEADIALCNMLAFYCQRDESQMQRLFRRSGLYRDKWDLRRGDKGTYGEITIGKAIEDCNETYTPAAPRKAKTKEQEPPEIDQGLDYISNSELKFFQLNDIGNAERFVSQYGDVVRYCKPFSTWYLWDNKRWVEDQTDMIFEYARNVSRSISIEAYKENDPDRRERILKHAQKSCSNQLMKAMVEQTRSMPGIPILPNQIDTNPWLFNCMNGTLDLKTCTLIPFSKDHYITKMAPVKYDPDTKAKTWIQFLNRIFDGNDELIKFVQRAAGYSLTGDTSAQCLFLCYGTGLNGKSTMLEALRNVVGDYGTVAAMSTFLDRTNQNNSNDIACLKGMRLATATEISDGARLNEALVKQLTGSDRIKARFLHKEFFEFDPTFKFWLAFNHKPVIRGTDNGIWRRIMLIPFNVQIPESEKDGQLPQKLRNESDGIFAWMIEGLRMWLKDGLNPPKDVLAATAGYRNEMDLFGDFLSAYCVIDPAAKTRSDQMYRAYCSYCKSGNVNPWPAKRVTMTMRERGFVEEPAAARRVFWKGIGLIQEEPGSGQWWDEKDSEDSEDVKFFS